MANGFVITIGRQSGCGGGIVGKTLADSLGIEYYDKKIIHQLIADDCGIDEDLVSELMERKGSSFIPGAATYGKSGSLEEQVFLSKVKIIKELADNHSCVIVGKCADYILRDYENVLNVFLYGTYEERIRRLVEDYKEYDSITEKELKHQDKHRAKYYEFFTGRKWGDQDNYDVMINTKLGLNETAAMLETIARNRFGGFLD